MTHPQLNKATLGQVTPSANLGPLPKLEWVSKYKIDIDPRYQREVNQRGERHVNSILRDFQWRYFQVITIVPYKADRYYGIDGQHRWLATMKHPDIDLLPCCVLNEMGMSEQAKVFEALNGKRLAITILTRFHTALAAGDPHAMKIGYICDEAGVKILKTPPQGVLPPCSLVSIGTIKKCLFRGDATLITALSLMAEVWKDKPNGFRAPNVFAVVTTVGRAGPEYDEKAMRHVLTYWEDNVEYITAYGVRSKEGGSIEQVLANQMQVKYKAAAKVK